MQLFFSTILLTALFFSQSCSPKTSNTNAINELETTIEKKPKSKQKTYPVAEYTKKNQLENYAQAVFAGGCFWCTEAAFDQIKGVKDVISGYSGGHQDYPGYYDVGAGTTGHAEAIMIYYDSEVITYETLLDVLFVAHDPTTLNRQGPDVGEAYRSAIYFQSELEQQEIDKKIKAINASDMLDGKIVTEVAPYKEFWVAEAYHQNFYKLNPNHGYVSRVSRPKVKKVMKAFPDLIKLELR